MYSHQLTKTFIKFICQAPVQSFDWPKPSSCLICQMPVHSLINSNLHSFFGKMPFPLSKTSRLFICQVLVHSSNFSHWPKYLSFSCQAPTHSLYFQLDLYVHMFMNTLVWLIFVCFVCFFPECFVKGRRICFYDVPLVEFVYLVCQVELQ